MPRCRIPVLYRAALLVIASAAPGAAHDLERTRVSLTFERDGRFELTVWNDPDWLIQRLSRFAEDATPSTPSTTPAAISSSAIESPAARDRRLAQLTAIFADRIVLFVDGHEIRPRDVTFVTPSLESERGARPLAGYRLRGRMPHAARTLRWYYGLVVDPYPFELARADGRRLTELVLGDAWSTSLDLAGQFVPPRRRDIGRRAFMGGAQAFGAGSLVHVAFVCGLMIASLPNGRRRVLTLFAMALGAGLVVTALDLASPRTAWSLASTATAASLAYVGGESVSLRPFAGWRLGCVVVCGVAHGAAIAASLEARAVVSPNEPYSVIGLLAAVSGLGASLLAVAVVTVACVACYRGRDWYHDRVALPTALAFGASGGALALWTLWTL